MQRQRLEPAPDRSSTYHSCIHNLSPIVLVGDSTNAFVVTLCERHVVVLANSLKYQKRRRAFSAIRHQVRSPRHNPIAVPRIEEDLLNRFTQKQSQAPFDNVERVTDRAMGMPRNGLRW